MFKEGRDIGPRGGTAKRFAWNEGGPTMKIAKMKPWEAYRASLILCNHFFQTGDLTYRAWMNHPLKKFLFQYLVFPFVCMLFFQGIKLVDAESGSEIGFMFVMYRNQVAIGTDIFIHPEYQAKGAGFAFLVRYAQYAHQKGLRYFIGKISSENKPSLKLTTKKMGMTRYYDRVILIPEANIPKHDYVYNRLQLNRLPKKAVKEALQFVANQMFSRQFQTHVEGMGGVIEPLWLGAVHELRYEGELVGYASVSTTDSHPIVRICFLPKWWESELETAFVSYLARKLITKQQAKSGLIGVQAGCSEHHMQLAGKLKELGAEEKEHAEVAVVGLFEQLAQLGEREQVASFSS
jgi:GNAT superfamily N-acetyltransferase